MATAKHHSHSLSSKSHLSHPTHTHTSLTPLHTSLTPSTHTHRLITHFPPSHTPLTLSHTPPSHLTHTHHIVTHTHPHTLFTLSHTPPSHSPHLTPSQHILRDVAENGLDGPSSQYQLQRSFLSAIMKGLSNKQMAEAATICTIDHFKAGSFVRERSQSFFRFFISQIQGKLHVSSSAI